MPTKRIFSAPGAVYHGMTRTVNLERLFDDTAKEIHGLTCTIFMHNFAA